ncbi:integral membrane protein GPR180-like [Haliotis rubra]|uniref:integral membrane protein GPR180-like n=1 Tax=Haliotis rubra TaxID=36100 RepID=UPI001EE58D5E|nr:integral membrane protein GPR180-like [Haliotis rubra]
MALHRNCTVPAIMEGCFWKSSTVFASHYLRDLAVEDVEGLQSRLLRQSGDSGGLFLWEQYNDSYTRTYHAHRSRAGTALVVLRILLAGMFGWNLYTTIKAERSSLKREFYSSFTKACMLWFLCYPATVTITWIFPEYLRSKLVLMGVLLSQSLAGAFLYKLFLSRSLYWEVSALSSTLPLRFDKTFSLKMYS